MSDTVTRYVPTHINRQGMRTLTRSAQGRDTFAAPQQAQAWMDGMLAGTPRDTLVQVFGEQAIGTFQVRRCQCWPVHFDPVGIYFD